MFPEPTGEIPLASTENRLSILIAKSSIPMMQQARRNINNWLEAWPNENDPGLIGNLRAVRNEQVRSATWELFVNWHLRSQGFKTEKLDSQDGHSTPDFLVSKGGKSFYVEATVRFPDHDLLWEDVVKELKNFKHAKFTVMLSLKTSSSQKPSVKKIAQKLMHELQLLEITDTSSQDLLDQPIVIDSDGWVIEATPIPLKGDRQVELVAIHCSGSFSPINDDQALRQKIETKRKAYKNLEHPLLLAILENSFSIEDSHIHRFDALFGASILRVFSDGSSRLARSDNGLWVRKARTKECAGLLLSHSDPLFMPQVQYPEMWINPLASHNGIELFSFPTTYALHDGFYGPVESSQIERHSR